jgi:uncharacterized protein (TIGR02271 family)
MVGWDVYDKQGEKVGRVGTVYVNDESQQPEWVTVNTGLFGHKESFVPLTGSQPARDGLHVGWAKDMIKDAPRIDADGRLSEEDSDGLYQYYGLPSQRDGGRGRKRGGGEQDQVMTRSEERLNVGTQRVETGRVRLRKYVVTEEQQVTVPVTHEEVRIEREPVRGGVDAKIGEQQEEVVLHADRPVVAKETVPVEQVRMHTEQVTEQQNVRDKVRKERIEVDEKDKR